MKKIIALTFCIVMLLVSGFFFESNKVSIMKQKVRENDNSQMGKIDIDYNIFKFGENDDFLPGVKFKLTTNNETLTYNFNQGTEVYFVAEHDESNNLFNGIYNAFSSEQKSFVNSIHTLADLQNKGGQTLQCYDYYGAFTNDNVAARQTGHYCSILLPTVFTIEETKVPTGYVKEKKLVQGVIEVEFFLPNYSVTNPVEALAPSEEIGIDRDSDPSSVSAILTNLYLRNTCNSTSVDVGKLRATDFLGTDYMASVSLWNTVAPAPFVIEDILKKHGAREVELCITSFDWINHKGNLQLEATSYVNNTASITTTINRNIEYKVVVKNTGDVEAVDSVIRTKVPEGFIYVEGTASDNGVYSNGFIEWRLDVIEPTTTKEYTYTAYAPKGVEEGHDYIGETTIENFALDEPVQANRTMVRLSFDNPKTAMPIKYILFVMAVVVSIGFFVIQSQQKQQQQKQQ